MWEWVDREIWSERMLAALETASEKGKQAKWFSLIDKVWRDSTLQAAWQQVKSRRGAAGVDGISIARFEAQAAKYLGEVAEHLKTGQYRAQAVRRVDIPKAGGGSRPLGIPTVKDRVVQAAVKRVIEPIFESRFCQTSYGLQTRQRLQGRAARRRRLAHARLHPRGGCRPAQLLRQHPSRANACAGGRTHQRRASPGAD